MTIYFKKSSLFLSVFAATLLSGIIPASAEEVAAKPLPKLYVHRTYEHSDAQHAAKRYEPNLGRAGEMKIEGRDKEVLSRFVQFQYKKTCSWEHNFPGQKCVKPHVTGKNFMIGYPLKNDEPFTELPQKVQKHLGLLPDGYHYVLVGDDVVLMNMSDRTVVDAVTLISTYPAE